MRYDDTTLVKMMRSAETRNEGFSIMMRQYGRELYWMIRRVVVDHDDAEDALQETAIKALTGIERFKGGSSLKTWLYAIANNEALQTLRNRKRRFQSLDAMGTDLVERLEAQTDLDSERATELFRQALLKLPTKQRIAFNLRYYDELPYEEIAKITGSNVSTLKSNYHFAVKKIEDYLHQNATKI